MEEVLHEKLTHTGRNSDTLIINILGMVASIISFVMWLPQAASTWKHRNNPHGLSSISKGTQYFVLLNASIWGLYGVLSNAYWTGAPGLVNFPLALMTLIFINRGEKMLRKEETINTVSATNTAEVPA